MDKVDVRFTLEEAEILVLLIDTPPIPRHRCPARSGLDKLRTAIREAAEVVDRKKDGKTVKP